MKILTKYGLAFLIILGVFFQLINGNVLKKSFSTGTSFFIEGPQVRIAGVLFIISGFIAVYLQYRYDKINKK